MLRLRLGSQSRSVLGLMLLLGFNNHDLASKTRLIGAVRYLKLEPQYRYHLRYRGTPYYRDTTTAYENKSYYGGDYKK